MIRPLPIRAAIRAAAAAAGSRRLSRSVASAPATAIIVRNVGNDPLLPRRSDAPVGRRWNSSDGENFPNKSSHLERSTDRENLSSKSSHWREPHGLEVGSEHWAEVVALKDYGALVRVDGCPVKGLVHVSEIDDGFVAHPRDKLQIGQRVRVVVRDIPEVDKLSLSMREAKPTLPDDFEPCTVVAFGVPVDLGGQDQIEGIFEEYGDVLAVEIAPYDYDDDTRGPVKVTYLDREMAKECLKGINRSILTYRTQVGQDTHRCRVRVRMDRQQNFKKRLLQQIDERHEAKNRRRELEKNPRLCRALDRDLAYLIPHYDPSDPMFW